MAEFDRDPDPWGKGGDPEAPGKCSACGQLSIPDDEQRCYNPDCGAQPCDNCGEMVDPLNDGCAEICESCDAEMARH